MGLILPSIFGLLTLHLGKDINWDLKNYHFYNAYAFLENRLTYDIAPAQRQTFLNPLLDVPFFILSDYLPSSYVGFIYGFLHGINLSLIFLIYWNLARLQSLVKKIIIGSLIVIVASTGPGFISELGGTMNDNLISVFILLSIVLLILAAKQMRVGRHKKGYLLLCLGGLIMGLAVGLKTTSSIYAIASGLLLPLLFDTKNIKIKTFLLYLVMGGIGFVLINGFWMGKLYLEYGHPLFPFYNNTFQSSAVAPVAFMDKRFLPKSLFEYLTWPIVASLDSFRVCELKFSDFRFAFLYIFLIFYFLTFVQKGITNQDDKIPASQENLLFDWRMTNFLLAFFISSYIVWMVSFSIYRYAIPLELLVPLGILIVLDRIIKNRNTIILILIITLLVGIVGYQDFDWGRTGWSTPYIRVDTSQFESEDEGLVIMLGYEPISYVIPDFPKSFRFVRPQSNLIQSSAYGLYEQMEDMVEQTASPIYVMYGKSDPLVDLNIALVNFHLALDQNDCSILNSNIPDQILFCKVTRMEPSP